jgi:cell division protein FtsQ
MRRAVSPAQMRRMRRRALFALAFCLTLECVVATFTSPALTIKHIRVSGTDALPAAEADAILRAAALPRGCNWFRVPRARMMREIGQMAWVKSVTVEKRLPDDIRVRVIPRQPAAVAENGTQFAEVDIQGVPIRAARPERIASLAHLVLPPSARLQYGDPIVDRAVREALRVLDNTANGQAVRIAKIEVDQSDNLCLNMSDRTPIRLGQAEDLDAKMEIVKRIYRNRPDIANSLAAIDLTCPAKPACISRKPAPSALRTEPAQEVRRKDAQPALHAEPAQEIGSQR